jgi:hypothetical protein
MFPFKSDGSPPVKLPIVKHHGTYVALRPTDTQLYRNMPILGTVPGSTIKNTLIRSRNESQFTKLYSKHSLEQLKMISKDTFYVVHATKDNYYKTVRSWDDKPEYSYENTEQHLFGLDFFQQLYKSLMSDCIASSEEISSYIDWTKSPGWPHTYFGFRTKSELVDVMDTTLFADRTKTLPLWNVSGKTEFKKLSDINENKIRLFQIPAFDLLYSQLKFGKRISLRLMNYHWSAYGFNPYQGGFNRLAEDLLRKPWRGCYDVSGWDKYLPLLKDMYHILCVNGDIPPDDIDEFAWMCENTCNFLLKTTDGNVFVKKYGNASGSGCTTRDNIFGHIIIFAAGLYLAYVTKFGKPPSFESIRDQIVYLYGDDNVFALDDDFSLLCDETFLGDHLAKYGLKLKFFFGGLNADLHTLSFLGAEFIKFNRLWYPKYDITRISTTMLYELDKLNLAQHLGKVFTLMVMSRPHPEFPIFYEAYRNLINSKEVQYNSNDPMIKTYSFIGVPELHAIDAFYCGSESDIVSKLMLPFSSISDNLV